MLKMMGGGPDDVSGHAADRSHRSQVEIAPLRAAGNQPPLIASAGPADIGCVAVPNPMTTSLDLSEADLVIGSFEEVGLSDVLHAMSR